jgi:hypothetical protein
MPDDIDWQIEHIPDEDDVFMRGAPGVLQERSIAAGRIQIARWWHVRGLGKVLFA